MRVYPREDCGTMEQEGDGMRFLYGFIAFWVWSLFEGYMVTKGCSLPDEVAIISMAIVVAGAMAGGD